MDYLVFQLQGPMASWGEAAVGEYRGSQEHPTASALAGLLAAALGFRRDEEDLLMALQAGYLFGVGVYRSGTLLRDYQTVQVPGRSTLKGCRHVTRRDELSFPRTELNTILSTRDYRVDVDHVVAVQANASAPRTLAELMVALKRPTFVLYLGRKSCPLSVPLHPVLVQAATLREAVEAYRQATDQGGMSTPMRLIWPDGMEPGVDADISVVRKDRLIRRSAWQFSDRTEHVAVLRSQLEE